MPEFGIVFPPWVYRGENDELLARILGEVGPDYVTIPLVTGPFTELRAERTHGGHVVSSRGGWHYQPDAARYAGCSHKPQTADWLHGRDVLPQMLAELRGRGVRAVFRVDPWSALKGLPTTPLPMRIRNLWDEELTWAGPCLLQPESEQLLRGLIADLSVHQPDGWSLVRWRANPGPAFTRQSMRGFRTRSAGPATTCLCAGCRAVAQRAGLDMDEVCRSLAEDFQRLYSQPAGGASPEFAGEAMRPSNPSSDYSECRLRAEIEIYQRLGAMLGKTRRNRIDTDPLSLTRPEPIRDFADWDDYVAIHPETLLAAFEPNDLARQPAAASADLTCDLRSARGTGLGFFRRLSAAPWWPPDGMVIQVDAICGEDAPQLVSFSQSAVEQGVSNLEFDGLHLLPRAAVQSLKQAVRFARRASPPERAAAHPLHDS